MLSVIMQRYVSSGLTSSVSGGTGLAAAVTSPAEVWTAGVGGAGTTVDNLEGVDEKLFPMGVSARLMDAVAAGAGVDEPKRVGALLGSGAGGRFE